MSAPFSLGLEVALTEPPGSLRDARRFAVLCNQASVDVEFRYAHELLAARFPDRLAALFGPQHGLWRPGPSVPQLRRLTRTHWRTAPCIRTMSTALSDASRPCARSTPERPTPNAPPARSSACGAQETRIPAA